MSQNLPNLPVQPDLKLLVIVSTLALILWGAAALAGWRSERREERTWLLSPLVMAVLTVLLGRGFPELHRVGSILVLGIALRNTWRHGGLPRWFTGLGAALWLAGLVLARQIFGG